MSKNSKIIILKSDKGNGVVVMDKTDYLNKALSIINTDKFRKINGIPITCYERKLNRLLLKLNKLNCLSYDIYQQMYASGSKLRIFYGLPKVHKNNVPLRSIISDTGTLCHKTAHYLAICLNH